MKHLVKFIVVTLLLFACTNVQAEQRIAFLDMKFVLNNSKAGKGAQEFLQKTFKESQEKYAKKEKELKGKETDLLTKRTILSKEDYKKEASKLREEVIKFQAEKRTSLEKIAKLRTNARSKLLEKLDPIVKKYISENNISMVLDDKSVVMGDVSNNITNEIVKLLNKEVPSISLK